ncbi:MAG: guanylate kinase [Actinomycetaceae bacterium]|nr:guanylate kinase [Actinomycetaceae bacterium]
MGVMIDDQHHSSAPDRFPLTVIVGPSGVGKGTVLKRLVQLYPQIDLSVSATTRPPRDGEINGIHYHFLSREAFEEAIAAGDFLEWATVHGDHFYGTLRTTVENAQQKGRAPVLEIDLDGARQVRKAMPQALFIFIAPPSWEELEKRLRGRGSETDAQIERRLLTARTEMAAQDEFNHVIVNDEVDDTVSQLAHIMQLA